MKALAALLSWLLLVGCCVAQKNSLAELQRKADEAKGLDCVRLSMQAARETLEEADRLFGAGDAKSAHAAVDTTLHYVQRSVDCSLEARKRQKDAEIDLRKLIHRMKDVLKTLDSEDQPHLKKAVAELEKQRDRLLHEMFGAAAVSSGTEKKP